MARGICPECDELVAISPTGEEIRPRDSGSFWKVSRWWLVSAHKKPGADAVCDGSGKRI